MLAKGKTIAQANNIENRYRTTEDKQSYEKPTQHECNNHGGQQTDQHSQLSTAVQLIHIHITRTRTTDSHIQGRSLQQTLVNVFRLQRNAYVQMFYQQISPPNIYMYISPNISGTSKNMSFWRKLFNAWRTTGIPTLSKTP